jgi:cellulose synthase operon protein C
MRIVCQKCSAAYSIDDKHVTAKGVRAQCPRCRHLQLVKKEDAAVLASATSATTSPSIQAPAPPAPPAGPEGAFHFDLGGTPHAKTPARGLPPAPPAPVPPPLPRGSAAPAVPFSFDFGPPPPPAAPQAVAQRPAAFDFEPPPPPPPPAPQSAQRATGFDFGPPPPPPPPPPAPQSAQRATGFDFGPPPPPSGAEAPGTRGFDFGSLGPPPPPPPSAPGGFDFGGLNARPSSPSAAAASGLAPSSPSSPAQVRQPSYPVMPAPPDPLAGSEPSSPFDFGPPPPPIGPASSPSAASGPQGVTCNSCGKPLTDPFDQALGTCDECRNKATTPQDPEVGAAPTVERLGPPPSATRAPAPAPVMPPAPSFPALVAEMKSVKSAARSNSGSNLLRTAAAIGVLALLVGLGVYLVLRPRTARRPPPLVVKQNQPPKQVEGIIQQWRLNYPELEGESAKGAKVYIEQGEELLRKDTTRAYLQAEEAFQKALVLEPFDDRALAGWALAMAFGRGAQIDAQTGRAAESMLTAGEQRAGDPHLYVAHAHLMIARGGNLNDIKAMADRGRNSPSASDRALAALALGQTQLTKNPQLADASFREALTLDPKLKRGYFFQAQLAASLGKYTQAIEALEHRLELDKDQWEAAEELARLYVDVGEPGRAKKVLENARAAAPGAGRPRLDLAMLAYQHLNEPGPALEQLTALVDDAEIPRTERADAWVHLAVLHRLAGDLPKAGEAVEKALEVTPESVPARLQKFLVLVERGVVSSARLELDALKDKLNDKSLEATLEGRLLIAENRLDDAFRTLSAAAEADPRRVDAVLLAGAAAARGRKDGKAWEYCLKVGLHADPLSRPVASLTHLYVRPADLLRPAVGAFQALSPNNDEDPNPALCEGLVAWFSDDLVQAEKNFAKVTAIDPRNADAYAYRTLVALAHKDLAGAARQVGRALDSSRSNALAYVAQGQVQMLGNHVDAAKTAATSALKYNASLLSAKTLQGEAAGRLKDPEEARRILTTVLLTDPQYREAKRVLYKLQL